ncbi:M14 family metallopeptidase [Ruminococcus sp. OA3]|uniref:M14 family metallopeptidase n=1 Tax=Ruminococcus sp. OA3 TaxID=2914164 RepID=UPI001F070C6D|nr:M14 family metallopeptidase [Ruminococcus sp. OA3]MCH1982347.1 M14 family metallopeptidase [Ruminococcus sp. OA3]
MREQQTEYFELGELRAARGEKRSGHLRVTGTPYVLHATVMCGERPGKTLLLTAGVHSCEYVGIQTLIEMAAKLEPSRIIGNVIIIPVVNRTGFEARRPTVVPEDEKNLNRVFPGAEDGTESQKLAWYMEQELFSRADYYVDLHSGGIYEELTPYVYYVGNCPDETSMEAQRAAASADVPFMVRSSASTGAYNYAGRLGIPSILIERGGSGRWTEEEVRANIRDLFNIMRCWGVMDGEPLMPLEQPYRLENPVYHECHESGLWYPCVEAGQRIYQGQVLGEIRGYHGELLETCVAEHDGNVLYLTKTLWVDKSVEVVAYARICRCSECVQCKNDK